MALRLAILIRVGAGWLAGVAIAVLPLVLPWCDYCLVPSGAIVFVALLLALPLLLVGLAWCAIWSQLIARHPTIWAMATVIVSFLYFLEEGLITVGFASCWVGAVAAILIFLAWNRYRPLLPSRRDTPSPA